MAVVDAGEMMEICMRQERRRVDGVHDEVESHEGGKGGESEYYTGAVHQGNELLLRQAHSLLQCPRRGSLQIAKHRDAVDERVDLEMHRQPQQHAREHDPLLDHGPHQRDDHHAQEPLGTPPRADRRNHGIQQPDTCKLQRALTLHPAPWTGLQHQHHQPSGNNVRDGEHDFAEREPCCTGPCGG